MCRRVLWSVLLALAVGLVPLGASAQSFNGSGQDYQSPAITLSGNCSSAGSCASGTYADFQPAGTVITVVSVSAISACTLNFGVGPSTANVYAFSMNPLNGGSAVSTASAVGTWTSPTGQFAHFYVWTTNCASGSVTFTVRLSSTAPSSLASAGGTVNTNATVVGPLDGSGNVKTAVQNFPSSQNVVCTGGCGGAAWSYFSVPASALCVSAPCVIKAVSGTLAALINLSTSAQPAGACTIYDNATAASGQALFTESQIGAGQVISFTANGLHFTNGAVIQCAANPGGSGLLVLFN